MYSADQHHQHKLPEVLLAPDEIHTDPDTFQYRRHHHTSDGIKAEHRFRGDWNPEKHNRPLLVYQKNNGEYFVVDGHHRLEFAKRLNHRFFANAPKQLRAEVIREADGITPLQARIIGAYRNFPALGGHVTPPEGEQLLEAAEAIHTAAKHPEYAATLPPLAPNVPTRLAASAASLNDDAFALVPLLPESLAVPIAAHTAIQPMPDATKVKVLHIIANQLAPLHLEL